MSISSATSPAIDARELDALVAEKLFGWQWYVHVRENLMALYPPEDSGWRRLMFNRTMMRPVQSGEAFERFVDWDRLSYRDNNGIEQGLPHYSTHMSDAWEVIAAMQKRPDPEMENLGTGYWIKIVGPWGPEESDYSVGFDYHGAVACGSSWVQAKDPNCARAICLAALFTIKAIPSTGHLVWSQSALSGENV